MRLTKYPGFVRVSAQQHQQLRTFLCGKYEWFARAITVELLVATVNDIKDIGLSSCERAFGTNAYVASGVLRRTDITVIPLVVTTLVKGVESRDAGFSMYCRSPIT